MAGGIEFLRRHRRNTRVGRVVDPIVAGASPNAGRDHPSEFPDSHGAKEGVIFAKHSGTARRAQEQNAGPNDGVMQSARDERVLGFRLILEYDPRELSDLRRHERGAVAGTDRADLNDLTDMRSETGPRDCVITRRIDRRAARGLVVISARDGAHDDRVASAPECGLERRGLEHIADDVVDGETSERSAVGAGANEHGHRVAARDERADDLATEHARASEHQHSGCTRTAPFQRTAGERRSDQREQPRHDNEDPAIPVHDRFPWTTPAPLGAHVRLCGMSPHNTRLLPRREFLALGGCALAGIASAAGSQPPRAASPWDPESIRRSVVRFVALRARLDGKPVFTIARGTDEAILDTNGAARDAPAMGNLGVPLRGQIIIQMTRAIDLGSGGWELPYVEGTLTTEPGTFRYVPELLNPLSGETHTVPRPSPYLARLRMDAVGRLANHVELPGGTTIDYSGEVAAQTGWQGSAWATQSLHIRIARPSVAAEDAYVTTTLMGRGATRRGFVPADSMSTSLRPQLPVSLGGGRGGSLVSSFVGRKFETPEALRRALEPDHRPLFAPLFDQWRVLLP